MKQGEMLRCHDVKTGDVVAVYLTTLQKLYHEQYDVFKVDFVSPKGWDLESIVLGVGGIPFSLNDVIAVWRREGGGANYNMVWFDEKYKDVLELKGGEQW